jgi:hypothetical protein
MGIKIYYRGFGVVFGFGLTGSFIGDENSGDGPSARFSYRLVLSLLFRVSNADGGKGENGAAIPSEDLPENRLPGPGTGSPAFRS